MWATLKIEDGHKIIKLQGDQRDNVKNFLIEEGIVNKGQIHVHGY